MLKRYVTRVNTMPKTSLSVGVSVPWENILSCDFVDKPHQKCIKINDHVLDNDNPMSVLKNQCICSVAIVNEEDDILPIPVLSSEKFASSPQETLTDVKINEELSDEQKNASK